MDYEIEWGGDPENVLVTTSGRATVEGLDAWVQEVLSDPRYRPGIRVLIDHQKLDWTSMTKDDLRRRARLLLRDKERIGWTRAALVTDRPVDYGLMRMIAGYLGERASFDTDIFYSFEKARDWLRAPGLSDWHTEGRTPAPHPSG
jgi:hypothetical protein